MAQCKVHKCTCDTCIEIISIKYNTSTCKILKTHIKAYGNVI